MIHRHLEYAPDTPVEDLPSAALVDILERGDLNDWQPIAAAVARDPLGEFADRVMRLVDEYPMYGTSPLWRAWIDRCRARAEGRLRTEAAMDLAGMRRHVGLTQVELAGRLGMSQSDLSKLERREDVRLSTLAAYVRALGGRLVILCEAGRARMRIRLGRSD
jgi:DNA-binding Xre family transcriptional regulator